ncbi:hypothetical protein ABZU32_24515 [Sphaerisporangium sp. NPDC005288]|uniref:hypothetical protein n=1 Tax=Sphaerisporangium sp. NPDC005288 TaxID=3155114 RepID=UPI0033B57DE2
MLYRVLADSVRRWVDVTATDEQKDDPSGTRLGGAWVMAGSNAVLGDLPMPYIENRRARFWFTEEGWRVYGRDLAAGLRARGHTIRVIRVKNPARSQVIYRDRYQVALLPSRDRPAPRRKPAAGR